MVELLLPKNSKVVKGEHYSEKGSKKNLKSDKKTNQNDYRNINEQKTKQTQPHHKAYKKKNHHKA